MFTVSSRQQTDGTFVTFDSTETLEDAIASARCAVDGQPNSAVYVFNDQDFNGKTYPYLVAKVACLRLYNGGTEIEVGYA